MYIVKKHHVQTAVLLSKLLDSVLFYGIREIGSERVRGQTQDSEIMATVSDRIAEGV